MDRLSRLSFGKGDIFGRDVEIDIATSLPTFANSIVKTGLKRGHQIEFLYIFKKLHIFAIEMLPEGASFLNPAMIHI